MYLAPQHSTRSPTKTTKIQKNKKFWYISWFIFFLILMICVNHDKNNYIVSVCGNTLCLSQLSRSWGTGSKKNLIAQLVLSRLPLSQMMVQGRTNIGQLVSQLSLLSEKYGSGWTMGFFSTFRLACSNLRQDSWDKHMVLPQTEMILIFYHTNNNDVLNIDVLLLHVIKMGFVILPVLSSKYCIFIVTLVINFWKINSWQLTRTQMNLGRYPPSINFGTYLL